MTEATTLALIAILSFVVTALFKLLSDNTKALTAVAKSGEKQAKATIEGFTRLVKEHKDGNDKSEKRNGHLGDQNLQLASLVTKQNLDVKGIKDSNKKIVEILIKSAVIAAEDRDILLSPEQHIETQIVDKQVIKGTK